MSIDIFEMGRGPKFRIPFSVTIFDVSVRSVSGAKYFEEEIADKLFNSDIKQLDVIGIVGNLGDAGNCVVSVAFSFWGACNRTKWKELRPPDPNCSLCVISILRTKYQPIPFPITIHVKISVILYIILIPFNLHNNKWVKYTIYVTTNCVFLFREQTLGIPFNFATFWWISGC